MSGALGSPILDAIAAGPLAWSTTVALARRLAMPPGEVLAEVIRLLGLGLVETWRELPAADDGTPITLTLLGAERLGVGLVEHGIDELPRWHPLDELPTATHLHPSTLVKAEAKRAITKPNRKADHGTPPRRGFFDRLTPEPEAEAEPEAECRAAG